MPKKTAQQMRLFALKTERKRRNHSGPRTKAARRALPEASRPTNGEPVQLDLIAAIAKQSRPN
jgi:hypothetical protein